MKVGVYSSYNEVNERKIKGNSIVVIDILRATTSIIEAIQNGVKYIVPVAELDEAVAIRRARGGQTLLAGEQNSQKIEGFDFGNSPLEFTSNSVRGRVVVMYTTNGTPAIIRGSNIADVWIGALRNREALCKKLNFLEKDITIICAGYNQSISADDMYAAGAYITKLREIALGGETPVEIEVDDIGLIAEHFYCQAKRDTKIVNKMEHVRRLQRIGRQDDIDYCFKEDVSSALGMMQDRMFVVAVR